jgi:hypothetical protein
MASLVAATRQQCLEEISAALGRDSNPGELAALGDQVSLSIVKPFLGTSPAVLKIAELVYALRNGLSSRACLASIN